MDNILKILLGVLGVAGLLAMLTPSGVSVAPPVPETIVEVATPVNEVPQLPPSDEAVFEDAGDEIIKFGEPTIDGNPIGDENAPQQQNGDNPNQSVQDGDGNKILNYQQILDTAAQGQYGLQAYQPAPTIVEPVDSGIAN